MTASRPDSSARAVGSDFATSYRARHQSWFGAKRSVKRLLGASWVRPALPVLYNLIPSTSGPERLPAPGSVREVTARMSGVEFVMVRPDRCVVAKELYWGHGRRPGAANQFALDVFGNLAARADLVLDIGAYTGIFALLAGTASDRSSIHAFEIVPDVAAMATENAARNGLGARIAVHPYGLGSRHRQILVPQGSGGSALPDFYSTQLTFADGVAVDVRPLDELDLSHEAGPEVLVKIDVEGSEHEVLQGATRFIGQYRPVFLCELLQGVAREAEVMAALPGYSFYLIEDSCVRQFDRPVADATYRDWLFSTDSPQDLLDKGIPVRRTSARQG